MNIVDFHNHFYPPAYLEALRTGGTSVRVTTDEAGNPVLHYPGDYNVVVPGHRDIEHRTRVLESAGVDTQVLTLTSPGTHVETQKRAVELARLVNDAFAELVGARRDRFTALATLPLNDPSASVTEFVRAIDDLGLPGAMLFSNVNGTALSDRVYWPLYEAAAERNAVLYIHPIHPVGVEAMTQYWLMPLVGFPADTTLAAASLVFSGVVEKFRGIRWVLAHLGGTIPYLAERLDRGYEAFEECRRAVDTLPSELLRDFWYDTVNFDPAALRLALDFAGAGKLLAGSDYPHAIGSIRMMKESIGSLDLDETQRAAVLGGNARTLLGLSGAG
ncbi:MAG TPA: amidohydrolase family protein [Longimicrobiales bacterium]|nr:amidohydrolase family protein [Longimicrobiales bacterium]